MKTVKLSEGVMNKLRKSKDGEAWGRIYTYKLAEKLEGTDTWIAYRWRTYRLVRDCGYRFTIFEEARRLGMLETVLVKGV